LSGGLGKPSSRVRIKLEKRIENQKLNTGACKDLLTWESCKNLLHHSLCSLVAVADGLLNKFSAGVYQTVVNTPTVDAEAANGPAKLARSLTGIAEAERRRTELISEIDLMLVPEPSRLLH